jgi:hydrogenase maturation protease
MSRRILVACIGNIFLGDDGFGVAVARKLLQCPLPDGVCVVDFGIRGMDLVYALLEDHDLLILVDTVQRGEAPGTLYLIEPQLDQDTPVSLDTHSMDPVKVLGLAHALGAQPTPTYLVGCEPETLAGADEEEVLVQLSAPVEAAVDEAVRMVEALLSTGSADVSSATFGHAIQSRHSTGNSAPGAVLPGVPGAIPAHGNPASQDPQPAAAGVLPAIQP